MLFLIAQIERERFAIPAERVVEVLPMVSPSPLPSAPPEVAGAMRYHDTLITVLDLTRIVSGVPAPPRLSTRVILLKVRTDGGTEELVGLIAERATSMAHIDPGQFQTLASIPQGARESVLGSVAVDREGAVRRVNPDGLTRLLTGPTRLAA